MKLKCVITESKNYQFFYMKHVHNNLLCMIYAIYTLNNNKKPKQFQVLLAQTSVVVLLSYPHRPRVSPYYLLLPRCTL